MTCSLETTCEQVSQFFTWKQPFHQRSLKDPLHKDRLLFTLNLVDFQLQKVREAESEYEES